MLPAFSPTSAQSTISQILLILPFSDCIEMVSYSFFDMPPLYLSLTPHICPRGNYMVLMLNFKNLLPIINDLVGHLKFVEEIL